MIPPFWLRELLFSLYVSGANAPYSSLDLLICSIRIHCIKKTALIYGGFCRDFYVKPGNIGYLVYLIEHQSNLNLQIKRKLCAMHQN